MFRRKEKPAEHTEMGNPRPDQERRPMSHREIRINNTMAAVAVTDPKLAQLAVIAGAIDLKRFLEMITIQPDPENQNAFSQSRPLPGVEVGNGSRLDVRIGSFFDGLAEMFSKIENGDSGVKELYRRTFLDMYVAANSTPGQERFLGEDPIYLRLKEKGYAPDRHDMNMAVFTLGQSYNKTKK